MGLTALEERKARLDTIYSHAKERKLKVDKNDEEYTEHTVILPLVQELYPDISFRTQIEYARVIIAKLKNGS